ncbi:unnamed protein product [Linum trigynum]|uniref:Uncharacterized protein n=1 Tax=Linum trigynum TaxID=586398 RepID=A0AAV2GDA9_9ROSI
MAETQGAAVTDNGAQRSSSSNDKNWQWGYCRRCRRRKPSSTVKPRQASLKLMMAGTGRRFWTGEQELRRTRAVF